MSNYVRKLVSGHKARFKDDELDLELDLVYVTDQIIIMGYPAEGIEGFYRNRREDAKKFLDHRHKNHYWIFNFCPLSENLYDSTHFGGRVSRYPFPDHHSPPLALLALTTREIRLWLDGSQDRVAVLHCKAGKGRSGTVACAYLLSLDITPEPPKLERSYSKKEWAQKEAQKIMDIVETNNTPAEGEQYLSSGSSPMSETKTTPEHTYPKLSSNHDSGGKPGEGSARLADVGETPPPSRISTLEDVLSLHTSRRMKAPLMPSSDSGSLPKKPKQGVSIPSQRRFLSYWSLILSRTNPEHFWPIIPIPVKDRPKVKLLSITVRLRDPGNAKMTLVKTINKVLDKTMVTTGHKIALSKARGNVWASLARYEDDFVDKLESWERHTRDLEGDFGKRRSGSERLGNENISEMFKDGKWDKGKMVRSFAKLGRTEKKIVEGEQDKTRVFTHVLTPLNQSEWGLVKESIKENPTAEEAPQSMNEENDASSFEDTEEVMFPDEGIVLDAGREVRVKLYMGQVFMGWLWFIPTFHMPQPPPITSSEISTPTRWKLSRKEIDFPLGIGSWIIDVDIQMVWLPLGTQAGPPNRQTSLESAQSKITEPVSGGVVAGMVAGHGNVPASTVETVQATRD